ncbi:hypothetical protein JCM10207_004816 [Rhodosporidiobolus poonsookiae]
MSSEAYDFAAHTRLDLPAAPEAASTKPVAAPQGPSFTVNAKLEPFLLLSKSARGSGAGALIEKAVAAPGIFVFSELLDQPSIKDLAVNEQHQAQYRLLELFAYGTWADYEAKRDSFPKLSVEQETKLKQLTILSLAVQTRSIPYATLLSTLSLPDVPALEDLLIETFYSGVLTGRLDQKAEMLEVLSATGRDVRPSPAPSAAAPAGADESMQVDAATSSSSLTAAAAAPSVADLTASITAFLTRISTLLSSLDTHLATLHASAINDASLAAAHDERVKAVVEEVQKDVAKGSGGKGGWKDKIGDAARGAAGTLAGAFGAGAGPSHAGGSGGGEGMDLDLPSVIGFDPSSGGGGGTARGGGPSPGSSAGSGGVGGTPGRMRKRGRM